jgi:CheY-like chemotaxis protein
MATILITEDNEPLRAGIARVIAANGHKVLQAASGVEAEAVFAEHKVDLLITDIIMPDRDGIELIQTIKQAHPGVPIIAISGGGRTQNFSLLDMTTQIGANVILRKPFPRQQLLDAIEQLLKSGQAG